MSDAPAKPLHAARSQIAEALLLRKSRGAFQVASAGSRRQRIDFLCLVPFEKLQRAALEQRIAAINRADASDGTAG